MNHVLLNKLKYWLQPTNKIFADFTEYVVGDKDQRRVFIDRGADILFVAHIDTVQPPKYKRTKRTKAKKAKRLYVQGLDDRLGCLIACELSEQLGVDLLLTDNEECCRTTAQWHSCKQYNWIAEFDRAGDDVVTYGLDNPGFLNALGRHFKVGFGSYSDICDMETKACCVNIGIGYELAHSQDSYVVVKTMQEQINRFLTFYAENKDITYIQQAELSDQNWCQGWHCDICGIAEAEYIHGYHICEDCFCNVIEPVFTGPQSLQV